MVARSAPRRRPAPRPEREHGHPALAFCNPASRPAPAPTLEHSQFPQVIRELPLIVDGRGAETTRDRAWRRKVDRAGAVIRAGRFERASSRGGAEARRAIRGTNRENERLDGRTSADSAARSLAEAHRDLAQVCVTTTPSLAGARPRSPNLASLYAILSFMKGGARPSTSRRFPRYFDQSAVFFIPTFWASVLA